MVTAVATELTAPMVVDITMIDARASEQLLRYRVLTKFGKFEAYKYPHSL